MRESDKTEKILVLWADEFSTNLGVQALAEGTRQLAELLSPRAQIEFRSYGDLGNGPRLGMKSIVGALFGVDPSLKRYLMQFDLVIDTGAGDSFADIYGVRRHLEMSVLRRVVSSSGVPLVMGPQTVGPFSGRLSNSLARWSVRKSDGVIVRDSVSMEAAKNIYNGPVLHGADVVFLVDPPAKKIPHEIMLNVSGLLWGKNPHVDWIYYRESVTRLASQICDEGYSLTLVAHVLDSDLSDNDMIAIRDLQSALDYDFAVVQPKDLQSVRTEISGAKLIVASRMHAALNALSTGVPAIPWAYSRKFEPLLTDLGWTHQFDLRDGDEGIVEATMSLIPDLISQRSKVREVQDIAVRRLSQVREFRKGELEDL